MNKTISVAKYEYKMQIRRIAGWLVLLFVFVSAMMDSLPIASNLARVEFLYDIHYYVRRVFSFDGLILLFGILFLIAGCLVNDRKTGRRDLFMAAPIGKGSYIGGKLFGNFLYAITLMFSLLVGSLIAFAIFSQTSTPIGEYIGAILEAGAYIIFPATFFVVVSSVILPELIDIRLFYLMFSIFFLVNAFATDTGAAMPFYIFTQGDLAKLIWQHPQSPIIYARSAALNLAFMLGGGAFIIILIALKRRFWRAD